MADKTVFICSFLLLALCVMTAAALVCFAPNPPTLMQARLLDSLLWVVTGGAAALFALIKSPRNKRFRGPAQVVGVMVTVCVDQDLHRHAQKSCGLPWIDAALH